jgi:hypothetical protein
MRGIQYPEAFHDNHGPGLLDHPLSRMMTAETVIPRECGESSTAKPFMIITDRDYWIARFRGR